MTDSVNSELAAQVVSAVRLIGLDIAGVDMVARDITRGLDEQGGAILEINAWPALSLHFQPFCPVFRPICESIIESLFPAGETSRIPLVVVTGGGDNLAIGRQLVRLLRVGGGRIGWASSEGLSLEGRRIKSGSQACLVGNRALLLSPDVEVAVLERSLEGIRREGLGLDQCDVAVVSRLGDVPPTDDLVQAARVLVESVPHGGAVVLDADDPALEALLEVAPATSILVAMSGEHPLIRSAKRSAVFLHNGDVVLRDGHGAEQVIAMSSPQRSASDAGAPPRELLMALAAAWAGRVPVEMIAKEMQRFGPG